MATGGVLVVMEVLCIFLVSMTISKFDIAIFQYSFIDVIIGETG